MKIIAKKNFTLKENFYQKGNEVKITSKEELLKLNEKGFIEPISLKEIEEYDIKKEKNNKKEEAKENV